MQTTLLDAMVDYTMGKEMLLAHRMFLYLERFEREIKVILQWSRLRNWTRVERKGMETEML